MAHSNQKNTSEDSKTSGAVGRQHIGQKVDEQESTQSNRYTQNEVEVTSSEKERDGGASRRLRQP